MCLSYMKFILVQIATRRFSFSNCINLLQEPNEEQNQTKPNEIHTHAILSNSTYMLRNADSRKHF